MKRIWTFHQLQLTPQGEKERRARLKAPKFIETKLGRVIPTRNGYQETTQKTYTVNEAAKKLGISRAAIHQALKSRKLEWTWGTITQVIERASNW